MNPIRDWQAELHPFLSRREPESLHVEYKGRAALLAGNGYQNSNRRASELSKDVSAFMNSDGGTIIYGVEEVAEGNNRLPKWPFDPHTDGFAAEEVSRELVENLITGNIQYRPGPELFSVTLVDISGRTVVVIDVQASSQGVFQAKDKKYYKRFNSKSEPMEHYEIEDVRNRTLGPRLKMILALTDTWSGRIDTDLQSGQTALFVGLVNESAAVATTAILELGIRQHLIPSGPGRPFLAARNRILDIDGLEADMPWFRCLWNPQNPDIRYTPVFKTEDPEYVAHIPLTLPTSGQEMGLFCWRIQSPQMDPISGIHRLRYNFAAGGLHLEPDDQTLEIRSAIPGRS